MANRLSSNLLRRCRGWAGQLTKLAKANAPEHLKKYIHSTVEPNGESPTYRIRIFVENSNPAQKFGSADARAQEYGSGLQAQFGGKHTYKIIGQPWLAFYVGGGKGSAFGAFSPTTRKGTGEKDIVIIHEVNHPGIPPHPYIRPAVKEIRATLRKELDETIREAIRFDMRSAFKGANQK